MGLEPLLLAFSSSDRQVRVLNPVVLPKQAGAMKVTQIQLVERRTIRQQAVCGDRLRLDRLVMQEALKRNRLHETPSPTAAYADFAGDLLALD